MDEETRRAFLARYAVLAISAAAVAPVPLTAIAADNGLPAQSPPPNVAPPERPTIVALYGPQSPGALTPLPDGADRFRVLYGPPSVGGGSAVPVSPAPSGIGQPGSPK